MLNSGDCHADDLAVALDQLSPNSTAAVHEGGPTRTSDLLALFEAATEVTLLCDIEGRIVHVGGTPELVLGLSAASLDQQSVLAAVSAQHHGALAAIAQQALQKQHPPAIELPIGAYWGDPLSVQFTALPLLEDERLLGMMVKAVERNAPAALRAAFAGDAGTAIASAGRAPIVVFFLDARGQCTFMNQRWTELTGQATSDAVGMGYLAKLVPDDHERFRTIAGAAHQARTGWRAQLSLSTQNGGTWRVDAAAASVPAPNGEVLGYVVAMAPFSTALADPGEAEPGPTTAHAAHPTAAATPATQTAPEQVNGSPTPAAILVPPAVIEPAAVAGPSAVAPAISAEDSARWVAPDIKPGYTEPELLLGRPKEIRNEEPEIPVLEPGLDKVTGLANRLLFAQHVASTVSRMQTDALTVSVSFVDMHGLAKMRQDFGSRSTNDYLFLLAKRLEATIRSIEIAGRIDGDILAVLSINWLFADDLPVVAQRLLSKLNEPLAAKDGGSVVIEMDLGMAVARPGEHVNDIFRRAWETLQRAKAGPEQFEIDYGVAP